MIQVLVEPPEMEGGELTLEGDRFRHLFRARRLGPEADLRVVDGLGRWRSARVGSLDRRRAVLELGRGGKESRLGPAVELVVGTPKPERAAWLVEKATELGVAALRFVATDRSPRQPGPRTLARWERVAVSALEQSGGLWLPTLSVGEALVELDLESEGDRLRWFAPEAERPLGDGLGSESLRLVIGPEGGFSPGERARLRALVEPARLTPGTLRVETAAIVAAAHWLRSR